MVVLSGAPLLFGCGVDPAIEDLVTIQQGVYGQTTYYNDTVPTSHTYERYTVRIYAAPVADLPPLTELVSGEEGRGFFEAELPPGEFEVCVNARKCQPFTVASGETVRVDYEAPLWIPRGR